MRRPRCSAAAPAEGQVRGGQRRCCADEQVVLDGESCDGSQKRVFAINLDRGLPPAARIAAGSFGFLADLVGEWCRRTG